MTHTELQYLLSRVKSEEKGTSDVKGTFLALQSGAAILDIGATQDLIGEAALSALEQVLASKGLKPVEVPAPGGAPTGIGGAATVKKAVLVPISLGGVPGTVHFVVISENVPPLLSVGLLEHLGATMCLTTNTVEFKTIGVKQPMRKESSGHRTIPLVEWGGGFFPVPDEARKKFGLARDAFMLKGKDSSAYAKQKSEKPRVPDVSYVEEASDHSAETCQVSTGESADQSVSRSRCSVPPHELRTRSTSPPSADLGPMCQRTNSIASGSSLSLHLHDGDRAWRKGVAEMASAGKSDVLHVGGHPRDVHSTCPGGERPEVVQIGKEEVPGGRCSDSWTVPTRGQTHQPGQSVRQLAGVRKLRSADQLRPEGQTASEGQGSGLIKHLPDTSDDVQAVNTSTSGNRHETSDRKPRKYVKWDFGDCQRATDDGHGLPADEPHYGRADARSESDGLHVDEPDGAAQLRQPISGGDLRLGGQDDGRALPDERRRGRDGRESNLQDAPPAGLRG